MSEEEKDKSASETEGSKSAGPEREPAAAPGEGASPSPTGETKPPVAAPGEGASPPPAGQAKSPAAAGAVGAAPKARPAPAPDPVETQLRAAVGSVPLDRLKARFPEIAGGAVFYAGVPIVKVSAAALLEVCRFLHDDPEADLRYLSNLHGTHHPDRPRPFEIVYNLYSINRAHWLELKVESPEGEEIPSVSAVWKTAIWHEREAYDLLGIRFSGHPDLTRILLPDDWVGHPLRKEYPLEGKEGDHGLYR